MRAVKIAAGLACGLMILLAIMIFTVRNPETALYESTVEILMQQEGLNSQQAIEERFPTLVAIRSNMNRMAQLKRYVWSKTQSPTPVITREESRQLTDYQQTIRQLQKVIRTELIQLMAAYPESRP